MDSTQKVIVDLHVDSICFAEDRIPSYWYEAKYMIHSLSMIIDRLETIHANAFDSKSFANLGELHIQVDHGTVKIHAGAFDGKCELMYKIKFIATRVILPNGIFNSRSNSMSVIAFDTWPDNNNNLNELFAGSEAFRVLVILEISNVELPQKSFRLLHASNFSSFRRLKKLHLENCGIEAIDVHAFNAVGRTLVWLNLERNWIQTIDIEVFRIFFETKLWIVFRIGYMREQLLCTCRLFELDLMQHPFGDTIEMSIDCLAPEGFDPSLCGIGRIINPAAFCPEWTISDAIRIVNVRITFVEDSIRIETNFTSKLRVLLMQMNDAYSTKCRDKHFEAKFICLNINKFIDELELNEIDEIRHAEFVSVTTIPILFGHGAKPVHAITVRREAVIDWPSGYFILIVISGLILGLTAGIGIRFFIEVHKKPNTEAASEELTVADNAIYAYAMQMDAIYTHPEPYVYEEMPERRRSDNYVEIIGTGYTTVS